MKATISGTYSRYVDGEKKQFEQYVTERLDKLRNFAPEDTVLFVRVEDGHLHLKNERARVNVALGNGERYEAKGKSVQSAFNNAYDRLVRAVMKSRDKIVDHNIK